MLLFMSCNLASAVAEHTSHAIGIVAKDGACTFFSLADHPNVSFSATDVVITTTNEQISYPLSSFRKLMFVYDRENKIVEIANSVEADKMDVYSIDGIKIDNLHTAPNGIYIIRNGNMSIKYIKGE